MPRAFYIIAIIVVALEAVATLDVTPADIVPEADLVAEGYGTPGAAPPSDHVQGGYQGHRHHPHRHTPGCTKTAFIATLQSLKPAQLKGAAKKFGLQKDDLVGAGWGHRHHPHIHTPHKIHSPHKHTGKIVCTRMAFITKLKTLKPTELKNAVQKAGLKTDKKTDDLVAAGWGHRHHPHKHTPVATPGCTKTGFIATLQSLKPAQLKGAAKKAGLQTDDLVGAGWGQAGWGHRHHPHQHGPKRHHVGKPGCTQTAFITKLKTVKPTELKNAVQKAGLKTDKKTDDLIAAGWGHRHHPHRHTPAATPGSLHCTKTAFIATLQSLKPAQLTGAAKKAGLQTDDLVGAGWGHRHHPHQHRPHNHAGKCTQMAFLTKLKTLKPTELKNAVQKAGLKTDKKTDDLIAAGWGHRHHPHRHHPVATHRHHPHRHNPHMHHPHKHNPHFHRSHTAKANPHTHNHKHNPWPQKAHKAKKAKKNAQNQAQAQDIKHDKEVFQKIHNHGRI